MINILISSLGKPILNSKKIFQKFTKSGLKWFQKSSHKKITVEYMTHIKTKSGWIIIEMYVCKNPHKRMNEYSSTYFVCKNM